MRPHPSEHRAKGTGDSQPHVCTPLCSLSHEWSPSEVQKEDARGRKAQCPQGSWQSCSRRPPALREPGVCARCRWKPPRSWPLTGAAHPAGSRLIFQTLAGTPAVILTSRGPSGFHNHSLSEDADPGVSRLASLAPTGDKPALPGLGPHHGPSHGPHSSQSL